MVFWNYAKNEIPVHSLAMGHFTIRHPNPHTDGFAFFFEKRSCYKGVICEDSSQNNHRIVAESGAENGWRWIDWFILKYRFLKAHHSLPFAHHLSTGSTGLGMDAEDAHFWVRLLLGSSFSPASLFYFSFFPPHGLH